MCDQVFSGKEIYLVVMTTAYPVSMHCNTFCPNTNLFLGCAIQAIHYKISLNKRNNIDLPFLFESYLWEYSRMLFIQYFLCFLPKAQLAGLSPQMTHVEWGNIFPI